MSVRTLSQPVSRTLESRALRTEDIHAAHADFVWVTLQRFGVRDADLEDQLQEVFVVVHQRLHTYEASAKITTWLYGIAMRVASVYRRRAYVRREIVDAGPADALHSEIETPDEQLVQRQARQRLDRLLDDLDLDRRAVFVMFEIEALSCAEIAEAIGIPIGTVYSRLAAARKDFEKALARANARDGHGGQR